LLIPGGPLATAVPSSSFMQRHRGLLPSDTVREPVPPAPVGPCGRTTPPMSQRPTGSLGTPQPPALTMLPSLRVAVLGAGTVGGEVLRLISQQGADLAHRIGGRLDRSEEHTPELQSRFDLVCR